MTARPHTILKTLKWNLIINFAWPYIEVTATAAQTSNSQFFPLCCKAILYRKSDGCRFEAVLTPGPCAYKNSCKQSLFHSR